MIVEYCVRDREFGYTYIFVRAGDYSIARACNNFVKGQGAEPHCLRAMFALDCDRGGASEHPYLFAFTPCLSLRVAERIRYH
jgi:hypothetical protein